MTTIDFDAFAAGEVVDRAGPVRFENSPVVYTPSVETASRPRALQAAVACASTGCPVGATRIEMRLNAPASEVSLRYGFNDRGQGEIPTGARLEGFDDPTP